MKISIEDLARKVRDVCVKEYGEDVVAKFLPKKESEDERVRKELTEFVKGWKEKAKGFCPKVPLWTSDEEECDRYIAWLEKQGGIDNSPLEGSTNFVMTGSSKKTDERNPDEFIEAHTEWSNALQEGFINVDMARRAVEMERERIKAEIEKRREAVDDHNLYLDNSDQGLGYSLALDDMLNFIYKRP